MTPTPDEINGIRAELARSHCLAAYEAVDAAWLALLKAAKLFPDAEEHLRIYALIEQLPEDRIGQVLRCASVDNLLNLNPPLESMMSATHEEIDVGRTARQLAVVRAARATQPKKALHKLVSVLKRVRNRRMHGFKSPDGLRDQEILDPAVDLLQQIGVIVLETLTP